MRTIPGRLFLLLLIPIWMAAASLHMQVDRKSITKGDTITFTIVAEGEDVEFPVVRSIDGFPILGTAQKTNISIINGKASRSYSKSYTFAPMRNVTIPPMEVKIDSKLYKTEPVKIEVVDTPAVSSAKTGEASLTLSVDKKSVHVGEPITLEFKIRYPKDKKYVEVQMQKPEFANFWIKQLGDAQEYDEGRYRVKSFRYLIFAQKAGDYRLGPLFAKLARRVRTRSPFRNDPFFDDDFFNSMFARLEWRRIASNSVDMHVEPLPNGVELYGDFNITASVDKEEVDANRPVHLEIRIEGYGNIDDVPKFEPDIPDAVVYADEPKIEARMENGRYGGTAIQKITVVSDRNYTIPELTLRYMDAKRGKIVEKRTSPVKITVKGGNVADLQKSKDREHPPVTAGSVENNVELPPKTENSERGYLWLYLIFAFAAGAGSVLAYMRVVGKKAKKERKRVTSAQKILKTKSDKELLEVLLPYAKRSELIESAVHKLEENIFEKKSHKIDKKELAWEVEDLESQSRF